MLRPPPSPPLFPYTTLFRSSDRRHWRAVGGKEQAQAGFRPDIEGLRAVAVLAVVLFHAGVPGIGGTATARRPSDRKSTRLNSSHMSISYAVFCLKKKKKDT